MKAANTASALTQCQIKVCGIRDPRDAADLDALGVDWLGFNFSPRSKRHITPKAAAPLVRGLRRAIPVGVFVDEDPGRVAEIIRITGIRYAQLHGSEGWEYIAAMPIPVIKAIPHDRLADLGGLREGLARAQAGSPTIGAAPTGAASPNSSGSTPSSRHGS